MMPVVPAFILSVSLKLMSMLAPLVWTPAGPLGGDARALATDPRIPGRVYLGALGGEFYRSDDSGDRWQRMFPGFPRRDQNLDEVAVNARGDVLVGFWDVHGRGGGVAVSRDSGRTFTIALDGESVRALSLSPSNPAQAVAGALSGVFATDDFGFHWRRISPVGHPELRNVESVAVDPVDPRIIYVGTWHLPWKTTDGGLTWKPVPVGMIEDSDVFTLTLDRRDPLRIVATACSGIYGSRDGALSWSRVRGIPYTSRRSRALAQDIVTPQTFYAGTTEGLWVSEDDTATWRAATPLGLVVNTIAALPDGTLLLGADGAGVLRSRDGARTWQAVNQGFSERFISRVVSDEAGGRLLASVWADRGHGGVFSARGARGPWAALGQGLTGRDVSSLAVSGPRVLAGTDRGVFWLDPQGLTWREAPLDAPRNEPSPRINDLAVARDMTVLAATSRGLFRSEDGGLTWGAALVGGEITAVILRPAGESSFAATSSGMHVSGDEGRAWVLLPTRPGRARVNAMAAAAVSRGAVLAATSRGVYRSLDDGITWGPSDQGLLDTDFTGLVAAPSGSTFFASDFAGGGVYRSDDAGESWTRLPSDGLVSDRIWTLSLTHGDAPDLIAAPVVGGLHVLGIGRPR